MREDISEDLLEGQQGFRVNRPISPSLQGPADVRMNSAPHESLAVRVDRPVDLTRLDLSPGDLLRLARQGAGRSITELAKELGASKGHLSAIEVGNEIPSVKKLMEYEQRLGLEPGVLTRAVLYYDPSAIEEIVRRTGLMEEDKIKEYAFGVRRFYEKDNEAKLTFANFHREMDDLFAESNLSPEQVRIITEQLVTSFHRMLKSAEHDQADLEEEDLAVEPASVRLERSRLSGEVDRQKAEIVDLQRALAEQRGVADEATHRLGVVRRHLHAGLTVVGEDSEQPIAK